MSDLEVLKVREREARRVLEAFEHMCDKRAAKIHTYPLAEREAAILSWAEADRQREAAFDRWDCIHKDLIKARSDSRRRPGAA